MALDLSGKAVIEFHGQCLALNFLPIFKPFPHLLEVSVLSQARVGPLWAQKQGECLSTTAQEPAGGAPSTGQL